MQQFLLRTVVFLFTLTIAGSTLGQAGGGPPITCSPDLALLTCSNSAVGNFAVPPDGDGTLVFCAPPSGSDFALGVTTVTCFSIGSAGSVETCSFSVTVQPTTDPAAWPCAWLAGLGIPYEPVGGAIPVIAPDSDPESPAVSVFPAAGVPWSGLFLHPGPAQGISFSTVLDFTAPVGAGFDVFLPPDPAHPNDPPLLSFRNKGPKGYCVKMNKRFATDPGPEMRALAVNTNGQLLEPLSFTSADVEANGVFDIGFQPGVSNCHIAVEMSFVNGSLSVEFPGPIVPATARKGWDGCIYGPDRPVKKSTSRVTLIPPTSPGVPPITDLYLYASGVSELPVQQPTITANGRKWGDGHVTLMKAYDDGSSERSLQFHALGDGGGAHVELGHAESFNLHLTKFATNLPLGEELLTRTIGPIRLTNRPAPPFLDSMMLRSTSDGVECSVDFSGLDSPTVSVMIYSNGVPVFSRTGVPGQLGQAIFTLPEWPSGLGKLGGRTPCRTGTVRSGSIRFPGGGAGVAFQGPGASPGDEIIVGDEFRIFAELPEEAPRPDYYSGFEFVTTAGADWGISVLQINPSPLVAPLTIICPSDILAPPTGPAGAPVSYFPTVLYGDCPLLPMANITCNPPSGSTFSLGTTAVTCTGHNGCGETPTCSFNVTVAEPPVIVLQPHAELLPQCPGPGGYGDVTLTVQATGSPAPDFYWSALCPPQFPNCGCILRPPQPGYATLVIPNFTPECAAGYFVVVSNAAGSVTSQVARVVLAPEVPFSDNRFPTPNSRFEFGSSRYLVETPGLPPVEVVISNLTLRLPGSGQALPSPGVESELTYDVDAAFQLSTDGGVTFHAGACSGPAVFKFKPAPGSPAAIAQTWDLDIESMTLSGGSLPQGMMLGKEKKRPGRESPTLASLGRISVSPSADGTYRISSFFDVFTELSLDGGQTWSPSEGAAARALLEPTTHEFSPPDDNFPPLGSEISQAADGKDEDCDGKADDERIDFVLPAEGGVISISKLSLQVHAGSLPSTSIAVGQEFDLECDAYLDVVTVGGSSRYSAPATVRVRQGTRASTTSRMQVVALDVSGGLLPSGMKLRESPTLPSRGYTSRRANGDGTFRVSSFFDIFTEISLDGGTTWSPASRPVGVGIRPAVPEAPLVITCPPNQLRLTCSNSAAVYFQASAIGQLGAVVCTPPSGSDFPLGVTPVLCVATSASGGVAECSFTVTVKPAPAIWACRQVGIGLPYEPVGGATVTVRPDTGDGDPAIVITPQPGNPQSGIRLAPGSAQAITFTTMLDFTAPVGAGFDLVLPFDPAHPNDPPILSFSRKSGPKGYCVKSNKRFVDEGSAQSRAFVVNTNGDLLDPLSFTPAEIEANGVFDIGFQPGVSNCHVTITLSCVDGSMTIEFPGPITPSALRKGWDGCIYGPDRPVKKGTSRVMFIPPPLPGAPPITELLLYARGVPSVTVEQPSITASGRKWGDGHVTLMKAYDDGEQGLEFRSFAPGGGVHVDLGHSESFHMKLKHFENGDIPDQDQLLTRTIGPIRGLTNRPPPPFLDALLLKGPTNAVDCSADFNNLDSPTVHVLLYNKGVMVAQRSGALGQLDHTLFTLPSWPETLSKLSGATPCRRGTIKLGTVRLPGGAGFAPGIGDEFIDADEFRVLAELPQGAPHPDFYSGFEFISNDGPTWRVSSLERTLVCTPEPLVINRGSETISLSWSGEGFRLEGAETVGGPWFDLGVASPVTLNSSHAARFFRLVCD